MKKTLALLRIWLWISLTGIVYGTIFGTMSLITMMAGNQLEIHQFLASLVLTFFTMVYINDKISKVS
jgi:uncharacterized membrane protein